jgi:hypothetical protein
VLDDGYGAVADLELDQIDAWPQWSWPFVVQADGSGLDGFRRDPHGPELVVIRWDGSVVSRDQTALPLMPLGNERSTGAGGERCACGGAMEDVPSFWQRADGTTERIPGFVSLASWTRDGTGLFVQGAQLGPFETDYALVRDGRRGLNVEPLAMPPPSNVGAINRIVGMTDDEAVLQDDDWYVSLLPLDGSPAIGPFDGALARVNP